MQPMELKFLHSRLFLPLGLLLLGACSPTKTYSGPELPSSRTSQIVFLPTGPLELSNVTVDGIEVPRPETGALVLPGEHRVEFSYENRTKSCLTAECVKVRLRGRCSSSVFADPGASYRVEISAATETPSFEVRESGTGRMAGVGLCRQTTMDWETSNNWGF